MKRVALWFVVLSLLALVGVALGGRSMWFPMYARMRGKRTVADAIREYGPRARIRLTPYFERAGVAYPPESITLLGFKAERRLELWARADGAEHLVRAWPVLAASGAAGPKLREGDLQVPEGRYRVVALNPNSSYHLSLQLDFPNAFDAARAAEEKRAPGGDIFIHGKDKSVGCLALGDEAIEELFTLVESVGIEHVGVILAPRDLRDGVRPVLPDDAPGWTGELYDELARELANYR